MAYGKVLVALVVFQIVLTGLGGYLILNKSNVTLSGSNGGSQSTRDKILQGRQDGGISETASTVPYKRAAPSAQTNKPEPQDQKMDVMTELKQQQDKYKDAKIKFVKGFKFAKSENDHQCLFAAFFEFKGNHYFELGVLTGETCENAADFTSLDDAAKPIKSIITNENQNAFIERFISKPTLQYFENANNNKYLVQFTSPTSHTFFKAKDDKSFNLAKSVAEFLYAPVFSDDAVTGLVNGLRSNTDVLKVVVSNKGPVQVKSAVVAAKSIPAVVTAPDSTIVSADNVPQPKELRAKEPVKPGFIAALKIKENSDKTAFQFIALFKVDEGYFIYFDKFNDPNNNVEFETLTNSEILRENSGIELNATKYKEIIQKKKDDNDFNYVKETINGFEFFFGRTGIQRNTNMNNLSFESIADGINGKGDLVEKVLKEQEKIFNRNTSILIVEKKEN